MPWSEKQNHLFRAIAHGWKPPASSGIHIKRGDASRMAAEGIKRRGGGLAMMATGGVMPAVDNTLLYDTNPVVAGQSDFTNESLGQIEGGVSPYTMTGASGTAPVLRRGGRVRYATGGGVSGAPGASSGVETVHGGNSIQDQAAQFGPRAAALQRLNAQIAQSRNPMMGSGVMPAMTRNLGARSGPTLASMAGPGSAGFQRALRPQWSSQMQNWQTGSGLPGYSEYGPGMADGGQPDPDWAVKREFDSYVGFAGGGRGDEGNRMSVGDALPAALLALRARHLNSVARPFQRAFTRPVMGIEAAAKRRLSEPESDARFADALEHVGHPYASRPVERGQGAWEGEHGMEFNPLYMQHMPRTVGRVLDHPESMRYASQMGEDLEQAATPVSRFIPHVLNTPEGANALQMHGVDAKTLRELAELMGSDVVTAHRPGNKAMVFPLENSERGIPDLATEINAKFGFPKLRYGRSDPDVDRVLLTRDQPSWATKSYADFGARPRGERSAQREDGLLSGAR